MWGIAFAIAAEPLVVWAPSPPTTLDPLFAWGPVDRAVHAMVHDRLVHPSASGWWSRLVADLTQDGAAATLRLERGRTWHDGHPIDAGDVCFTLAAWLLGVTPPG